MIIQLKQGIELERAEALGRSLEAIVVEKNAGHLLITTSKLQDLPPEAAPVTAQHWAFPNDLQLGSRDFIGGTREVRVGDVLFGGDSRHTVMMTGPCSIESEEQIEVCAQMCVDLGVKVLRAGAFKPRTSPYSFQGMGLEGLQLLAKMRDKYGLRIISEVRDATHIEEVIEYVDIVQVGAKAMYDQGILRRCGAARKPVLLKRGFGSTLQEFAQAAEFVLSGGNDDVILCERGIRTFETKTRFTLDLCGVAWLKAHTNLPVVLDPSHAMGHSYGVPDLTRACTAMGVDGLLIESHPNPKVAKSDAAQQLDHETFRKLHATLPPIAGAAGRKLV